MVLVRGFVRNARIAFFRDLVAQGTANVVLAAEIEMEDRAGRRLATVVEAEGTTAAIAHCLDAATLVRKASEQALLKLATQIGERLAAAAQPPPSAVR